MNCCCSGNVETDYGICVTDCNGRKRAMIYNIRRGQLVKLHEYGTNNVRFSTLDNNKKLTTPRSEYFRVINDTLLYECLNAINGNEQRIQFYANSENYKFVLNLKEGMTVLAVVTNYQLKALFRQKVTRNTKTYFTLELLEEPSQGLVRVLRRECLKYDHRYLQLTVAANMIQKLILPDVINQKNQLWVCSNCNQENMNSKTCRYCKNSTAGHPGKNHSNNPKDTNRLIAEQKLPANEKDDPKSPRTYDEAIFRNEKQPTGIPKSGSSLNSNHQTLLLPIEGPKVDNLRQPKHDNVATNQFENVSEKFGVSDDIIQIEYKQYDRSNYERAKRSNEVNGTNSNFEQQQQLAELGSRLAWRCDYCYMENIDAQCTQCGQPNQATVAKRKKTTQWTCIVCFNINEGYNCDRCYEKRDEDDTAKPTVNKIPFDTNLIVPAGSNTDILPDCFEINKPKPHESMIIHENADLMEHYGIMVSENAIETNCMNCNRFLHISTGYVLQLCKHTFCDMCIKTAVTKYATEGPVDHLTCRALVNNIKCDRQLELAEIKYFLSKEIYEQFKIRLVDANETNSFIKMCYDKNCSGYYLCEKYYQTPLIEFLCSKCNLKNCLQCSVIHDGVNCMQYGKLIGDGKSIDKDTLNMFLNWIRDGTAMLCPECNVLIEKDEGCDWVQCSFCQTEICWATRGHRWGPGGNGDTSGGCGCTKEKKCVETCKYCH